MNIIGDIAGNYKTLLALLKKMPDGEVISVGDMVDRGPKSKEVLEWFMKNGTAILGNHEHMMLDFVLGRKIYSSGIWLSNGGTKTIHSFGYVDDENGQQVVDISVEIIEWLDNLPLYIKKSGLFISHSFNNCYRSFRDNLDISCKRRIPRFSYDPLDDTIIWNRYKPTRMGRYQVAGHNSQFGLRRFSDDKGEFAICIDTSRHNVMTGIHWPSMKIYQQGYID